MGEKIVALLREQTGKGDVRRLRRNGRIPAILYGDGHSPTLLSVDAREFMRTLGHGRPNQLLELRIEDSRQSETLSALLREIQRDPLGERPLHIDFVAVNMEREVHLRVPLRVIGEHERIKDGAVIEQLMHELDIACLPSSIPDSIEVDVSGLKVGDTIDVNELHVGDGIKIRSRPEDAIVTAVIPVKAADLESLSPEQGEPVAAG